MPTGAGELLGRLSGKTVRGYSTYAFGRGKDSACLSVVVPKENGKSLVQQVRRQLPTGLVAFMGTSQWLGDESHDGIEVVVGPGDTQFDILRLARSDACNYDMDTEDLVRRLQSYDTAFGIDIFHAETDTIEFDLVNIPPDPAAFAADLYEFCPDIVDQGIGSVEELAEAVSEFGQVFLWWD